MHDSALQMLRSNLDDDHLALFATRLTEWLLADPGESVTQVDRISESRSRALLRASKAIDGPTLKQFSQQMAQNHEHQRRLARVALYDLLKDAELADNEEIVALAVTCTAGDKVEAPEDVRWCLLAVAAFAWHDGYSVHHLDPASPPGEFSPAGQVVKRAAHLLRRQVERSATERDKLARRLAYVPEDDARTPLSLEHIQPQQPVPPLPPHFRPPIPVNYPEVASETLELDVDEPSRELPAVPRADAISITDADLEPEEPVQRMPPIRITAEQTGAQEAPGSTVTSPPTSPPPIVSFATAVRRRFSRGTEPFTTTKLSIIAQSYPDGPGLYGLQVHVRCRGVNSYVAGTTSREGRFLCSLPVRVRSGLTYDVDVTWPRDLGGEVERKSITLNGDRTEFTLPFYHRMNQPGD